MIAPLEGIIEGLTTNFHDVNDVGFEVHGKTESPIVPIFLGNGAFVVLSESDSFELNVIGLRV